MKLDEELRLVIPVTSTLESCVKRVIRTTSPLKHCNKEPLRSHVACLPDPSFQDWALFFFPCLEANFTYICRVSVYGHLLR